MKILTDIILISHDISSYREIFLSCSRSGPAIITRRSDRAFGHSCVVKSCWFGGAGSPFTRLQDKLALSYAEEPRYNQKWSMSFRTRSPNNDPRIRPIHMSFRSFLQSLNVLWVILASCKGQCGYESWLVWKLQEGPQKADHFKFRSQPQWG